MYICMYINKYIYIYISIHVCMYACMYVCMYVCMYSYILTVVLTGNGICAVAAGVLAQLAADQVKLLYQQRSTCFTSTKYKY